MKNEYQVVERRDLIEVTTAMRKYHVEQLGGLVINHNKVFQCFIGHKLPVEKPKVTEKVTESPKKSKGTKGTPVLPKEGGVIPGHIPDDMK